MALRVVLTRASADNERLADLLRLEGVEVVDYPCIGVSLISAAPVSDPVDAVAFTSRNAVRGFFFNRLHEGLSPRIVAAVGESTSRELQESGWRATHLPADPTAESLGMLLRRDMRRGEILLWPRGNLSTGDLEEILMGAGIVVVSRVVYDNTEPTLVLLEGECTAVVVASPSAVDRFLKTNPERTGALFVAIGPKTAHAARDAGCARVIESPRPTPEDVCRTVLSAVQ
ncbi:MAG: uroporphyrinogen-III synthase [Acidobacteria bacterium]|nr:uroporphyrinogen-III synthase [Acidobacteriota bacterium]